MNLFSFITRPLKRGILFMSAAANMHSAICLALFSNHRTFPLAKKLGSLGIKLKMTGDFPVFLDFGSSDHRTIFIEIFVEKVYSLEELNFTPEVIIDCGAHIGLFSRIALAKFPDAKLIAFEPNKVNFNHLVLQCVKSAEKVNLINAGVGLQKCSAFLVGDGCQGVVSNSRPTVAAHEIQIIDLNSWIKDTITCNKLLLKIDIEGGEFDLIPHILSVIPKKTVILFETHGFKGKDENLIQILENHQFRVSLLRSRVDNQEQFADYIASRE